jgi:tetratricopeptide (TPR) repeat protein
MQQWEKLVEYLEHDPDNLSLIADAANAAFDAGDIEAAKELLDRYHAIAELPPALLNLQGLVAIRLQDVDGAAAAFDALLLAGVNDPSVRFNRAWVHALKEEHAAALALLDDETVAVAERAAALKVQTLHHLGQIEEALSVGQAMIERYPHNDSLLGALSVAAMDADNMDLARHYAGQASGGVDAFTTRGLLALNDNKPSESVDLFNAALALHPDAPRAWIGKGLGLVAVGDVVGGSEALRIGAEIFGDHLGSWIALGWTQFMAKDSSGARKTFDHALSLDDNFAETYGALAVVDLTDGKIDSARRRADIALRLDRACFGGMLAKMLLAEAKGDSALAQRVWDKALNAAVGAEGQTLAQAISSLGFEPSKMRPSFIQKDRS